MTTTVTTTTSNRILDCRRATAYDFEIQLTKDATLRASIMKAKRNNEKKTGETKTAQKVFFQEDFRQRSNQQWS